MTTASPLTKREVDQDDDGGDREREGSDGEQDDEGGRTLDDIIDSYADD